MDLVQWCIHIWTEITKRAKLFVQKICNFHFSVEYLAYLVHSI